MTYEREKGHGRRVDVYLPRRSLQVSHHVFLHSQLHQNCVCAGLVLCMAQARFQRKMKEFGMQACTARPPPPNLCCSRLLSVCGIFWNNLGNSTWNSSIVSIERAQRSLFMRCTKLPVGGVRHESIGLITQQASVNAASMRYAAFHRTL